MILLRPPAIAPQTRQEPPKPGTTTYSRLLLQPVLLVLHFSYLILLLIHVDPISKIFLIIYKNHKNN